MGVPIYILFLDILNHVEYNELLGICKKYNVVTVVITDESEKMNDLNANIILNGNPNQLKYNYDDFAGKYLTGPRYFIMDQDYSLIENNQPNVLNKKDIRPIGRDKSPLLEIVCNKGGFVRNRDRDQKIGYTYILK